MGPLRIQSIIAIIDLVDYGSGRVDHEVCHGALARLLVAVDVVRDAHLVPSPLAVSAS